ncbi:hypothetical protein R83H12_02471 [Fibrobacteria bacterium R8-3-H12]
MTLIKVLRAACVLFAGMAVLTCSDGNSGSQPAGKEAAGKTNDNHDLVVFDRGDLDEILFKIDTVYITDTSFLGRLYFRNLPENKTPEPGDIINSSITKVTPYGFLYRVVEISKESDGVTVISVGYASLAEAVEEADVEFEIPLVYDEEDGAGAALQVLQRSWWRRAASAVKNTVVKVVNTVVDAIAGNWDVGGTKGETFSVNKGKSFSGENYSGGVSLDGSYTLSLITRIKLKHYSLDYAKMSISQNKYLELNGNLNGSLSYSEDFELAKFRLPDIEFMVGPVYVYIENDAVIKAKVEAKAQASINAKLVFKEFSEYGFEYDGKFKKIDVCNKDFSYDYKHSAYGSVRFGVLVGFNSLLYGVAGLQLTAGPSIELKSPSLPLTADSKTTLNRDLDINAKVKLQLMDFFSREFDFGSARVSLGSFLSSKTLPSFDFKRTDFDFGIADGKFSFPFKIDKPDLGLSVDDYGFCMESSIGECIKGPGFGKLGTVVGSSVNFDGLVQGMEYSIVPFFKSLDGEYHYMDAVKFVYGVLLSSSSVISSSSITSSSSVIPSSSSVLASSSSSSSIAQSSSSSVTPSSSSVIPSSSSVLPSSSSTPLPSSNSSVPSSSSVPTQSGIIYGTPVTYEGETYQTVVIGAQTWFQRNLNYNTSGSKCYNYNVANCATYGRLYNWEAAMSACPPGWRLPSNADWNELVHYVDGSTDADTSIAYESPTAGWHLKATSGWSTYGGRDGQDKYGFSALPGGYIYSDGTFNGITSWGEWWSSSEGSAKFAYGRGMYYNDDNLYWSGIVKSHSQSVRCIKD